MAAHLKQILIVSYYFPPVINVEAIQVLHKAMGLSKQGWRVQVLASGEDTRGKLDPSLCQLLDPDITVHRTVSLSVPVRLVSELIGKYLQYPDRHRWWVKKALHHTDQILKADYCPFLYTHSTPLSAHLVGLRLKAQHRVKWVAHFSDPWTDNPYITYPFTLQATWNRRMEHAVMDRADLISVTSQPIADLFLRRYPAASDKMMVVPHCFSSSLVPSATVQNDPQRVRIVHTGNIYANRTPEGFFRGLRLFLDRAQSSTEKLSVDLFGRITPEHARWVRDLNLGATVHIHPALPYLGSLSQIRQADFVLLIDAPAAESVFLPAKLIDYLGVGAPILALTPEKGVTSALVREAGGWVVDPLDADGVARALASAVASVKSRRTEMLSKAYQRVREQFECERVMAAFSGRLESLLSEARV